MVPPPRPPLTARALFRSSWWSGALERYNYAKRFAERNNLYWPMLIATYSVMIVGLGFVVWYARRKTNIGYICFRPMLGAGSGGSIASRERDLASVAWR